MPGTTVWKEGTPDVEGWAEIRWKGSGRRAVYFFSRGEDGEIGYIPGPTTAIEPVSDFYEICEGPIEWCPVKDRVPR